MSTRAIRPRSRWSRSVVWSRSAQEGGKENRERRSRVALTTPRFIVQLAKNPCFGAEILSSIVSTSLRGRLLSPRPDEPRFDVLADALIEIDTEGRICTVGPAPVGCQVPESHPGAVLLPGFVDTHIHFPQLRVLGSASGPLLQWLSRSVFPEEARFADPAYAAEVAREFCDALIAQGTTCAAIYSSSHPAATDT